MHPGILQVQPEPWPSGYGDVVAMLEVAQETLAAQHALEFFEGDYTAAAIRLPSGRRVGLLRHVGAPYGGIGLYADTTHGMRSASSCWRQSSPRRS